MSDLSYRIVGEGPPLLLLHGFGISYNIWQALVPLLHSHFQLILVELPGIGASPPLPAQTLYYVSERRSARRTTPRARDHSLVAALLLHRYAHGRNLRSTLR
ncbi:MAG: alpha/beta fold hydrolase [Caldilineaceae bacterium]